MDPPLFLNELNGPLNSFINSWYTKGYSYAHLAKSTINKINTNDQFFDLRLNREHKPIPLGWFLSVESRNEIVRQLGNLHTNAAYLKYISTGLNRKK